MHPVTAEDSFEEIQQDVDKIRSWATRCLSQKSSISTWLTS